ncbi:MAG TPA: hypothetical protein VJR48_09240, partial [Ktedonobacterales bacterium]|nr:hypothetical protein [Ktedonobacterales bacterium]
MRPSDVALFMLIAAGPLAVAALATVASQYVYARWRKGWTRHRILRENRVTGITAVVLSLVALVALAILLIPQALPKPPAPPVQFTEHPIPAPGTPADQIALGPDGAFWFTEPDSGQIGQITTSGEISEFSLPTAHSAPNGITAGPDGALWFTETSAA